MPRAVALCFDDLAIERALKWQMTLRIPSAGSFGKTPPYA
jgi:hypothetical protein